MTDEWSAMILQLECFMFICSTKLWSICEHFISSHNGPLEIVKTASKLTHGPHGKICQWNLPHIIHLWLISKITQICRRNSSYSLNINYFKRKTPLYCIIVWIWFFWIPGGLLNVSTKSIFMKYSRKKKNTLSVPAQTIAM